MNVSRKPGFATQTLTQPQKNAKVLKSHWKSEEGDWYVPYPFKC